MVLIAAKLYRKPRRRNVAQDPIHGPTGLPAPDEGLLAEVVGVDAGGCRLRRDHQRRSHLSAAARSSRPGNRGIDGLPDQIPYIAARSQVVVSFIALYKSH